MDGDALKLNPLLTMCVIETGGGSGSLEFIRWLQPRVEPFCAGMCRTFDFDRWGAVTAKTVEQRAEEEPEKVEEEKEYVACLPPNHKCMWSTSCQQMSSVPVQKAIDDLTSSVRFLNSAQFWRYILLHRDDVGFPKEAWDAADAKKVRRAEQKDRRNMVSAKAQPHWDAVFETVKQEISDGPPSQSKLVWNSVDSVMSMEEEEEAGGGSAAPAEEEESGGLEWNGLPLCLQPLRPDLKRERANNMKSAMMTGANPFALLGMEEMMSMMPSLSAQTGHTPSIDQLMRDAMVSMLAQVIGRVKRPSPSHLQKSGKSGKSGESGESGESGAATGQEDEGK